MKKEEALKLLKANICVDSKTYREIMSTVENGLDILNLIISKKVNLWAVSYWKKVKDYNEFRTSPDRKLTEQEFKKIKEYIENGQ